MRQLDHFTPFLAGSTIGVPTISSRECGNTRKRIREAVRRASRGLKARAEQLGWAAAGVPGEKETAAGLQNGGRRKTMNDMKNKAKQKVDEAATAAKKAADKVVDMSKDVAHSAGKTMEKGGKTLQDA